MGAAGKDEESGEVEGDSDDSDDSDSDDSDDSGSDSDSVGEAAAADDEEQTVVLTGRKKATAARRAARAEKNPPLESLDDAELALRVLEVAAGKGVRVTATLCDQLQPLVDAAEAGADADAGGDGEEVEGDVEDDEQGEKNPTLSTRLAALRAATAA